MSADLIIRGGTVVPMERDDEWFDADVVVRDGRIAEIVRHPADSNGASVLDADGCLVLPGLIQCHVHVVQSLLRHQADGLPLLDWLHRRTLPYEAALDGDGVETAAELGIAELLAGGTTTALDFGTTHHHDRVFGAAERLGIRMVSGRTHMDVGGDGCPSALVEDADASLADAESLGARWHGAAGDRLRYAVSPRFALSCSRALLEGCAELARRHGWLLHSHAAENVDEVAAVRTMTGLGNIEFLDRVGLTGADVVLAHGVHLTEAEVELLADTRTRICHCPGANLKLGSGIADVPGLRARGVLVGIGADGPPCNNRLSVLYELALAATLHGVRSGPASLGAWQALAMATRDGARALHLDHAIGTLTPGKAADIVVIATDGWAMLPGGDPASRVVYGATAADVRHTVVDGRAVVVDRRLQTTDAADLRRRVDGAWRATRSRMGEP